MERDEIPCGSLLLCKLILKIKHLNKEKTRIGISCNLKDGVYTNSMRKL